MLGYTYNRYSYISGVDPTFPMLSTNAGAILDATATGQGHLPGGVTAGRDRHFVRRGGGRVYTADLKSAPPGVRVRIPPPAPEEERKNMIILDAPNVCCLSYLEQVLRYRDPDEHYPDEICCPSCGCIGKLVQKNEDVSWKMGLPEGTMTIATTEYIWYAKETKNVVM